MKRRAYMLLALLLALVCLATSCTTAPPEEAPTNGLPSETAAPPARATYTVRVVYANGTAAEGVIVQALQNGEIAAMASTNAEGIATLRPDAGTYTVALDFPLAADAEKYRYSTEGILLTPETPAAELVLYNSIGEEESVIAYSVSSGHVQTMSAYTVAEGGVAVQLSANERTYFVFRPTRPGTYRIRFESEARFELGYYGIPINGSRETLLPVSNKSIELIVRKANIGDTAESTTAYLFGLAPKSSITECILFIERVGEAPFDPVDEPWRVPGPGPHSSPYAFLNWRFADFVNLDVTDPDLRVVYSERDGYYHFGSEQGPIVFVRITSDSPYLTALSKVAENVQFGRYFYDEAGNFLYKESYNELMLYYASIADQTTGVCPLNEQLAYVIQSMGEAWGWWDASSGRYLFSDTNEVTRHAWLFACGYYQTVQPDAYGTAANPINVNATGTVRLRADQPLTLRVRTGEATTVQILKAENLLVTCNGVTYRPQNGEILFSVAADGAELVLTLNAAEGVQDVTLALMGKK